MEILNVFIAIIVAFGFWRRSTKEQRRKTANASLIKTIFYFLLSVAVLLFYYKTYQVARFINSITIDQIKGNCKNVFSYEPWTAEDSALYIDNKHFIPYDRVYNITLMNRFTDKPLPEYNILEEVFHNQNNQSGISTTIKVDSREGRPTIYRNPNDSIEYEKEDKILDYLFNIYLYTNDIPSFFPFAKKIEFKTEDSNGYYYSSSEIKSVSEEDGLNTLLTCTKARYRDPEDTDSHERYVSPECFAEGINTLNFFSAADLSQCEYEIRIFSDMPVDSLFVYFDIPVVISGWDLSKYELINRGFKTGALGEAQMNWGQYIEFHVTFPTLANMQLIRSLILTTLLTAIISLFLVNLYYYLRKIHTKYTRHHRPSYRRKKRFLLVFIPAGKIMAWVLLILFSNLLWKVYKGESILINASKVDDYKYYVFGTLLLLTAIVYGGLYLLYLKGYHIPGILYSIKKYIYRNILYKKL